MNDVREAIERVGARFDPGEGGLEDLPRRRTRARRRRRVLAGALALAVMAGGSLLLVRAFPATSTAPHPKVQVIATWGAVSVATPAVATPVECPTPSGDSPPPVVLSDASGVAGSSIQLTGSFWNDGLWMQLWWNAAEIGDSIPPPPWPPTGPDLSFDPAGPGPVVKLATIASPASTGECSFKAQFTVPDVQPGTYQLRWFFGGTNEPNPPSPAISYVWSSVLSFEVTG